VLDPEFPDAKRGREFLAFAGQFGASRRMRMLLRLLPARFQTKPLP
jgi:hypothetical protein